MTRTPVALALSVMLAVTGLTACTTAEPPAKPQVSVAPSASSAPAPASRPCDDPRASLRPAAGLQISPASYMQKIKERGRLIVGTNQGTVLFSSRDPFTGRIEGFDIDVAREVARAIFGDPDRLELRIVPNAERMDKVEGGTVDMVVSTMTVNCARRERVDFSTVYYEAGQRLLVGKDSPVQRIEDLGDRLVCSVAGSTSLDNLTKVSPPPKLVVRPDYGACLVAFQLGEAEAVSTDDTILAGMAAQDPYAKVVGPRFTEEPYAIAIAKTHPEFTQYVNAVLERMRADGTWAKIYSRWLGGSAPAPPAARYR
ncbi:putative glutamine-binding protein GlnH [Actinoplanes philippinensis]|uniref:Polar amino acid transport system substrate-binding protein n=1 Tax=Actinoplanes philippinensis TaxID=35752 RepID=A0A1I2D2R6_9ACTN|nr:glutamate ABC transporter substrate-binding protein [Actinoplanes philippinensis]GIE74518.1 putative glutamine-binding protein GlnH [Actinoplanes philippinensis]SFE74816.1 polar amino acid transport system substrate-binding protein [Actinoplanes philippinensis]